MNGFSVTKIFVLRIIVLTDDIKKYKIDVVLDLVFIILGLCLQIIYVNTLILITKCIFILNV